MKLSKLTLNQKLGLIAILLGIIALFSKDPTKASYVKIEPNKILLEIRNTSRFITPLELAEKIIKGVETFIIVDLRNPNEYEKGTLPQAVNLSVKDLLENALARNQQIIIFSEDDTKSLNAWLALKSMSYRNIFVLKGGYNGWIDEVLYPKLKIDSTQSDSTIEKVKQISQISIYFGGTPIYIAGGQSNQIEKMEFKSTPTQLSKPSVVLPKPATTSKPKREGC